MKENFTEPLLKEVKPILQEFSVPSPHFSPRIDSSKMTEYPRQEFFSAPSPPFSPHHGSPTIADSPKEEFSGASSYFSKRLDSQMLAASPREQLSTQLPRSSPPIQAPTPVQVVQQEIPAPPSYFSPQFNSPKAADPPVQAPSPRFSPPIKSPPVVQSPKPEAPAPSPPILARTNTNPFRPAESQSPKQEFSAVSPRFSPQMNAPKVSTAPKQQVQSNGNTRNGFSGFMQNEIEVAPRDFSVPSPRFTPSPRLESPKMAESPKQSKQMTETSTNGSRGSLKEEKKTETRGVDESMQEGVKVAPRPFSHQIHQSIVSISPRSSTLEVQPPAEEEPNRISTNSPPPTQKFRMLANSKTTAQTSDSEQSTRDEIQRAPSVISNLSIDEMLMDIPQPQPVKEVRQSVVEVKGKEAKTTGISNGNGNGNGNASQTTTEAEDAWTPPKNFKMKKTKKTFSTRY